jgi:hypothetical protein
MAMTKEDLKTIAATSAIAAAGGALATALVTYAVERWILKVDQQPMFVVVPVVDGGAYQLPTQPSPETPESPPMVAGYGRAFGAAAAPPSPAPPAPAPIERLPLTAQQMQQFKQMLPWRYWEEFYKCWEDEDPAYMDFANCRRMNQMYEGASDQSQEQMEDVSAEVPNVGKTEFAVYLLLAGGAGVAVGLLIGTAMAG